MLVASGSVAIGGERREFFGVQLLDHAEAAELPLLAVEVTVVVSVAGDEAVAADVVVGLDALDHMHGEGNRVIQGFPSSLSAR